MDSQGQFWKASDMKARARARAFAFDRRDAKSRVLFIRSAKLGMLLRMNVQLPTLMDKAAFLAWAQGREGRYELAERRVVMMAGGSKMHAVIASRLIKALWGRLDQTKWVVLGSDLAVDVGPGSLRYPGAIVDTIGGDASL